MYDYTGIYSEADENLEYGGKERRRRSAGDLRRLQGSISIRVAESQRRSGRITAVMNGNFKVYGPNAIGHKMAGEGIAI